MDLGKILKNSIFTKYDVFKMEQDLKITIVFNEQSKFLFQYVLDFDTRPETKIITPRSATGCVLQLIGLELQREQYINDL